MAGFKMDTEVRREQIAQAALGLIASEGMKGFEIAAIAAKVGIVPSAIYRHFKNKDEIIDAVLELIRDGMMGHVAAVCEETNDPLERLGRLTVRQISLLSAIPVIPQIIYSGASPEIAALRGEKVHENIKKYLTKIREIIIQGQKSGDIRPELDSEVLSLMLMGTIQQAALMWHLSDGRFDPNKHAKKAWEIYRDAIAVNRKCGLIRAGNRRLRGKF